MSKKSISERFKDIESNSNVRQCVRDRIHSLFPEIPIYFAEEIHLAPLCILYSINTYQSFLEFREFVISHDVSEIEIWLNDTNNMPPYKPTDYMCKLLNRLKQQQQQQRQQHILLTNGDIVPVSAELDISDTQKTKQSIFQRIFGVK